MGNQLKKGKILPVVNNRSDKRKQLCLGVNFAHKVWHDTQGSGFSPGNPFRIFATVLSPFVFTGSFEHVADCRQQCFFTERLGEEINSPHSQRFHPVFRIVVGGDKDDWNASAFISQAALHFQSIYSRQADIEKDAPGFRQPRGIQKFFRGRKCFSAEPVGPEETDRSLADRFVIVHNRNQVTHFFFHANKLEFFP
jgi:hypothetical protein